MAVELEAESDVMFGGEIKVDESYFGGGGGKGKRVSIKPFLFCLYNCFFSIL